MGHTHVGEKFQVTWSSESSVLNFKQEFCLKQGCGKSQGDELLGFVGITWLKKYQ